VSVDTLLQKAHKSKTFCSSLFIKRKTYFRMNPIIVVTGGTKGIGRAVIEKFAAEGFDIITCARNEADLLELKNTIQQGFPNIQMYTLVVDLSAKIAIDSFVSFVKSFQRPVEILVNNAGVFKAGHQQMIETNLYSVYDLCRGLIPDMIVCRRGHIFNLCSIASIVAYPNGGSYSVSKFALYGLTKALREELKPYSIKVTALLPGATLTASWDGVNLPESRFIKAGSFEVFHA